MVSVLTNPSLLKVLPLVILIKLSRLLGIASQLCHFLVKSRKSRERLGWKGYQPDSRDVIVAVHSKSGTNWMLQMAVHVAYLGEKVEFEHILELVPWPGYWFPGPPSLNRSTTNAKKVPDAPTGLRVIKTHVDPVHIPYSKEAKYISVLRDPKEVVTSAYHFWPPMFGLRDIETPQAWLDFMLEQDDEGFCFTLARHLAHCWERRNTPNWLVLTYSQMIKDPLGTVQKVAKHMGIALTQEQVKKVAEFSSFEYMKKIDDKFRPTELPWLTRGSKVGLVRQGTSGPSQWKELYNDQELQRIDAFMLKELEMIESDLPYREYFMSWEAKSHKS